jgi:hypothetical protein
MRFTSVRRILGIGMLLLAVSATTLFLFQRNAHGQAATPVALPKTTLVTVLDNARVTVRRDTFPVGGGEPLHSSGTAGDNRYVLMILITPAMLEGEVDGKKLASDKPGTIWELPGAPSQHAFKNLSKEPIDVMVVQLK